MTIDNVRIMDFGWVWAGALPGQMSSFLGAEVIKIESSKRLDYMRRGRPIVGDEPDPDQQPMFHNINRGKKSLSVDLSTERGRELVLDLAPHCDAAVENFAPGVLDRLGLGFEQLNGRNERLVLVSLSGGGQWGPLREMRSYASTIAAYCGLDALAGYEGEEPLGVQQAYPDPNASLHGAIALLAALIESRATGVGFHAEVAQLEAGLATVGEALVAHQAGFDMTRPLGNVSPHPSEEHLVVACDGDDEWVAVVVPAHDDADHALAEALGALDDLDAGSVTPDDARDVLAAWCAQRSGTEAMEALQGVGLAAGAVTSAKTRFENAHYQARRAYLETSHPVIGWEMVYREPWGPTGLTEPNDVGRAPLLGEHNEYVVCELLGRSQKEYATLVDEGVLDKPRT